MKAVRDRLATRRAAGLTAAAAAGVAAWSLYEAQWVECHERQVAVAELPAQLAGLTVLHLSDFHLGAPSLNGRALRKAVDFGVARAPDLVVVTGDILSNPRGEATALAQLARLDPPLGICAVMGNHDCGATRDPWSRAHEIVDWGNAPVTMLRDRSLLLRRGGGATIEVAGLDPLSWLTRRAQPELLFRHGAGLRVLLTHFPDAVELVPAEQPTLVLAGHLHGGQIRVPDPRPGRAHMRFAKLGSPYAEGIFRLGKRTLVVSRGIGTTLVPFRLLARPEAALLRLVAAPAACQEAGQEGPILAA